jgi:hypothetical protein
MEPLAEELVLLSTLVIKKLKLEKKLRKTIKCLLRKCFSCMGMTTIEEQLKSINEQITELSKQKKSLMQTSNI